MPRTPRQGKKSEHDKMLARIIKTLSPAYDLPHTIHIPVQADASEGDPPEFAIDMNLSLAQFWAMHQAINTVGIQGTIHLLIVGIAVATGNSPTLEQWARLPQLVTAFMNKEDTLIRDDDDFVLGTCYDLLAQGAIKRRDAAIFANDLLHTKYSSEAWRKRVNAWATNAGKPPLDLPKGRKPER